MPMLALGPSISVRSLKEHGEPSVKRAPHLALTGSEVTPKGKHRRNSFHLTQADQKETSPDNNIKICRSLREDGSLDSVEIQQEKENLKESREESPSSLDCTKGGREVQPSQRMHLKVVRS